MVKDSDDMLDAMPRLKQKRQAQAEQVRERPNICRQDAGDSQNECGMTRGPGRELGASSYARTRLSPIYERGTTADSAARRCRCATRLDLVVARA